MFIQSLFSILLSGILQLIPAPVSIEYACGDVSVHRARVAKCIRAESIPGISSPEGYILEITTSGTTITATGDAGFFYAKETLEEIIKGQERVPVCKITDYPRFEWRGIMLDVSRHFFSVPFIKKQIDAMARYKLNRLHLHLTDAAGWRIEIDRYPLLTDSAAWRCGNWKEWWKYSDRHYGGDYGGYYTKEDIRDIVKYAADRQITVVPEIEMPGHSEEVLAMYPELSCAKVPYRQGEFCIGNEETYTFLENILTEVMELFPSEYIHIGGDEASKRHWRNCPECQAKIVKEGLSGTKELQGYLIRRIHDFLAAHGRKMIGWDEIFNDKLPQDAAITLWRDVETGEEAMAAGHKVIFSPGKYCYLDQYQDAPSTQPEAIGGYVPLKKVYEFEPSAGAWGIQGNLWTEYVPTEEHVEYMLYPRTLAIAENGWSPAEKKDYEGFRTRALEELELLRTRNYSPFNLASESGPRPESALPVKNIALGKTVKYADGAHYWSGYRAAGDSSLTDGLKGDWTYQDGRWQGFIGRRAFDVTVDLEEKTEISYVGADFMQLCGPGVYLPAKVIISTSNDGKTFKTLAEIHHTVVKDSLLTFKTFEWSGTAKCRYVRYKASYGPFGGFLFTDEIVIR